MWCWDVWSHRNPINNIIRFLSDSCGVFHVTCYHVVLSIFIYLRCFGWFNLMCIILLSHPEHNHLRGAARYSWSDCVVVSYQRPAVSTSLLFPLIETILSRRSAIIMWGFFFYHESFSALMRFGNCITNQTVEKGSWFGGVRELVTDWNSI